MKFLKPISVFFACVFYISSLFAQEHEHVHGRNEIGFSGGAIYSFDHDVWGGGIHVHYFRTIGKHGKWSLGGSIEQVWAEGGHFNVSAGGKYQITDRLSIGVLPGLTFFESDESDSHNGHDSLGDPRFALHFELVYDLFHWERFHMGPAIDYSWTKDDSHMMIGIHAAFAF